jgi:AAA family ATP:ADP antiporter
MLKDLLKKIVPIRDEEVGASLLAFAYGFCIFVSYYILRPVRDEIAADRPDNITWVWIGVFLVMLGIVPLYSALVARFSRGVFIPIANRFFIANLLIFYGLLHVLPIGARGGLDIAFYIWVSVFALFVPSVFWGFMADLFRNEQGKRLFGFFAAGISLGGIAGSTFTHFMAEVLPDFGLLLCAAVPLEGASWCARSLHRRFAGGKSAAGQAENDPVPGTLWSGIGAIFRSKYLGQIAIYLFLMTCASTVLYREQSELISQAIPEDRDARVRLLADIDLAVQVLTLFAQGVLFAHVLRILGSALTLAMVPALAVAGFFLLGAYPALMVLVVFQVLYRFGRYAVAKPAREILYTQVGREEKYKSKAFIDTVVYRGGDVVWSFAYDGLHRGLGFSLGAIAYVAAPLAAIWAVIGFRLGRQQEDLAAQGSVAEARDESAG